jgi:RecA-family ATPase
VALLRYVCSLPNPGTKGAVHELFYPDNPEGRARAEKFAQRENKPGHGVYDCIGFLQDGARSRCRDTVAALDQVVADLDLKNIMQPRDAVLQCVKGLVLPPSEIRDSGFGLHLIWHLKEPVEDDTGLTQAETTMKQLAELLAGDPAPTHRAALLRRPHSDNTKEDEPRPCRILEASSATYDISEFADMLDLYADRALLKRKAQAAKGNGHDHDGEEWQRSEGPVDVEAELAAMEYESAAGNGVNATVCRVIPSLLRKGEHPADVLEHVVAAVMTMAERCGLKWSEQKEIKDTVSRILSAYHNLLMRDFDPAIDGVPEWLPGDFHEAWMARIAKGQRPVFGYNRGGFYVRAAQGSATAESHPKQHKDDTLSSKEAQPRTASTKRILVLRPFVPFDPAKLPPREWLYGKHYQRRTVSMTAGPGGMGKTSLGMVEYIVMAIARNLLGEQPTEQLRVWLHNGEDPLDEIYRRLAAICQEYAIPQELLKDHLWITSGNEFPLRVAKGYTNLQIDRALVQQISDAIGANQIDLAAFDPFVTMHSVSEGDPGKMDTVVRLFAGIADEHDCAIELNHHVRKPAAGSDAEHDVFDIRGVLAITDAVRSARVLNRMNKQDASNAGIEEIARLSFFRVDRAKGNYSPAQAATWRQFVNVTLPNGDEVGVVKAWDFPGQGISTPEKAAAERKAEEVFLRLLDKFLARGGNVSANPGPTYAPAKFAEEREARAAKVSKAALKGAMDRLLDSGKIRSEAYTRNRHRLVLVVEDGS